MNRYYSDRVPITFNSRTITIPWFRVGIEEINLGAVWETFKDWKAAPLNKR